MLQFQGRNGLSDPLLASFGSFFRCIVDPEVSMVPLGRVFVFEQSLLH